MFNMLLWPLLNKTVLWSRSEWNQIQTWHSLNKHTNSLLGFMQTSKEHKHLQGNKVKIKIRENRRSFRVQEWKQTTNRQELKEIKTQRGAETVQEVIHKVEPRRGALQGNGQAAEAVGSSGGGDLQEAEEEVGESRAVFQQHCSIRDQQRQHHPLDFTEMKSVVFNRKAGKRDRTPSQTFDVILTETGSL